MRNAEVPAHDAERIEIHFKYEEGQCSEAYRGKRDPFSGNQRGAQEKRVSRNPQVFRVTKEKAENLPARARLRSGVRLGSTRGVERLEKGQAQAADVLDSPLPVATTRKIVDR
jgi:hypothetical protein